MKLSDKIKASELEFRQKLIEIKHKKLDLIAAENDLITIQGRMNKLYMSKKRLAYIYLKEYDEKNTKK